MEIIAKEIIRAVDTFLIKTNCPCCDEEQLVGLMGFLCNRCGTEIKDYHFEVKKTQKRNLVAVPDKKRRIRISKQIVRKLYAIQEGLCAYCSADLSDVKYHVEHILPISCGGTSNFDNLVISCPRCNLKAGSKFFSNFYEKQKFLNR